MVELICRFHFKIHFMKNLLILLILLGLFSCEDYTIQEKTIFERNIKLYDFYESNIGCVASPTGLFLRINKTITNGDSTKCELVAKNQTYLTKVDFDGNIEWSRLIENTFSFPYSVVYDDKQNIYSFENGNPTKFIKFNQQLNIEAEKSLFLDEYTKTSTFLAGLDYWKENKFLGYGSIISKGGSNYRYRVFFCIISLNDGIEKFVLEDEERPEFRNYRYKILPNGEIFGIEFWNAANQEGTMFSVRNYDSGFKLLKLREIQERKMLTVNNSGIKFMEDSFVVPATNYKDKSIEFLSVSSMAEQRKTMSTNNYFAVNIIPTFDDNILYFRNANDVMTIDKSLKIAQHGKLDENPYLNPKLVWQNAVFGLSYIDNGKAKSRIVFSKHSKNIPINSKTLYESQYKRKCTRWMD